MKNFQNIQLQLFPFLLLGIFSFSGTYGSTAGPYTPGSITNVSISGSKTPWINISNICSSDNNYATINSNALSSSGDYTDYITGRDFGFEIPSEAIINGIVVEIERGDINNAKDYSVKIIKNNALCRNDYSKNTAWSSESFITYGAIDDLWGEAWLPSDINSAGFGIAFACKKQGGGANPAPFIDNIKISVYYSFTTLPISLLYFNAEQSTNNTVFIKWGTASETNNSHFTLEKSIDGKIFEIFEIIQGAGTISSALSYHTEDKNVKQGIIYYRLKQTDYNGVSTYSDIIFVNFVPVYSNNLSIDFLISNYDLNKIIVQLNSPVESSGQIILINQLGENVLLENLNIISGENKIELTNLNIKHNVYHLVIVCGNDKIVKSFYYL